MSADWKKLVKSYGGQWQLAGWPTVIDKRDEVNPLLQNALRYHNLGWSIIPIHPGQKKPLLKGWKVYQTQRPAEEEIHQWWAENPNAGIAVILGQISGGLVVLDFDGKGAEQLAKDQSLPLPPTTISTTGAGLHYLYHSAIRLATKTAFLKGENCHIEVRAEGSIIVLPPSEHSSGKQYEWIIPPEEGIANLPASIIEEMQAVEEYLSAAGDIDFAIEELPARVKEFLDRDSKLRKMWGQPAPDDDQSKTDFAFACRCLARGLSKEDTATAVWLMPYGKRRRDHRGPDYVASTVQRAAAEIRRQLAIIPISTAFARMSQDLSDGPFRTLLIAYSYQWAKGVCRPSQDTLAYHQAVSWRTIHRNLKKLEERGYIEIVPVGSHKPNIIKFLPKALQLLEPK